MNPPSPAALAPRREPTPKWWPFVAGGVVLVSLLPLYLTVAPLLLGLPSYEVSGGQIVARSLTSSTVIPATANATAVSVGPLSKDLGSNAPSYMVGRFHSERGELTVYGNGSGEGLLFDTYPPTFITPENPKALLDAWKGGQTATFRPAAVPLEQALSPLWMLIPLTALVISLLLQKPRLSYELAGDLLTVRTRASTTRFPRRETQASLTADPLGMRLFGTALPGYYTGTYATRAGNVQAAASARSGQALLLECGGKRYYLTPTEPEALVSWFESKR